VPQFRDRGIQMLLAAAFTYSVLAVNRGNWAVATVVKPDFLAFTICMPSQHPSVLKS